MNLLCHMVHSLSLIHISEAASGGPIALVEEGDLIEINIPKRILRICGIHGKRMSEEAIAEVLKQRKAHLKPFQSKYQKGALKIFSDHAVSAMKGGYME